MLYYTYKLIEIDEGFGREYRWVFIGATPNRDEAESLFALHPKDSHGFHIVAFYGGLLPNGKIIEDCQPTGGRHPIPTVHRYDSEGRYTVSLESATHTRNLVDILVESIRTRIFS